MQPAATALAFSEVGLLTASGTLIFHRTLSPQVVNAGIALEFTFSLLPPEGV